MSRLILAALAALALAVPAATAAPAESAAAKKTIAAIAADTPQLSTLRSLVERAGLADELSGTTALTVFAPICRSVQSRRCDASPLTTSSIPISSSFLVRSRRRSITPLLQCAVSRKGGRRPLDSLRTTSTRCSGDM